MPVNIKNDLAVLRRDHSALQKMLQNHQAFSKAQIQIIAKFMNSLLAVMNAVDMQKLDKEL